jgi:hypothetical protein
MLVLLLTNPKRRMLIGLLIGLLATVSSSVAAQSEDDIKQWLRWLGVTAATTQADRIITQEVSQLLKRQAINGEQVQPLSLNLSALAGSDTLTASVASFVIQHFPDSHGALAQTLQNPLFVRARNFDVAMEMEGAFQKYKSFDNKQILNSPSENRIVLLKQLDRAQRTSHIAALIQTGLNIIASKAAANMAGKSWQSNDPQWLRLQIQQRERHMSDVIVRLNLFSYRFMKDNELEDYIKLLQSSGVQLMLDLAVRGIQDSLSTVRSNISVQSPKP